MTLARLANVTAPPLPPAPGVQAGRWAKCQTTKPGAVWAQVWLPRGRWLRPQAPTDGRTDRRTAASQRRTWPRAGFSRHLVVLRLWALLSSFSLGASRCGDEKRGCLQLGARLLADQLCPDKPSADPK